MRQCMVRIALIAGVAVVAALPARAEVLRFSYSLTAATDGSGQFHARAVPVTTAEAQRTEDGGFEAVFLSAAAVVSPSHLPIEPRVPLPTEPFESQLTLTDLDSGDASTIRVRYGYTQYYDSEFVIYQSTGGSFRLGSYDYKLSTTFDTELYGDTGVMLLRADPVSPAAETPEPASAALLALGGAGLTLWRLRRSWAAGRRGAAPSAG